MKKEEIEIGDILNAASDEELKHPFEGKVEKIYENSALLSIISFDPEDETSVSELNNKMIINFKSLKKGKQSSKKPDVKKNEVETEYLSAKKSE